MKFEGLLHYYTYENRKGCKKIYLRNNYSKDMTFHR